ncbi:5338_t:CDS:2 [Diversispora eburnea]|uniref:RING-type E3 ubiquitin transferase n=1 Tax=Diversispora eburnea TaxID=1213867 RepID=A0A9N8V1U8_9GLOM|nr:5338_t:CDS:2 [Diversispora eburnea]
MSDQANTVGGSSPGNSRRQYWCHQCEENIEPLMAPHPTCPRCNGDFVEEIDEENDPRNFTQSGGHESDEEYDDMNAPFNMGNRNNEVMQIFQNMITALLQSGPNGPFRVQTETRDEATDNHNQPFLGFAQIIQRALEGAGNNHANILNLFNITGDPRDYAWGSTGFDNIISQLMEQQAGRQAPPPASDEIIENLPKLKISKKQVDEQLGCPVCKDEFQIDEEAIHLPCTHTFHGDCIKPWLKVNGTCPVCRYSLVSTENDQNQNHNGSSGNNTSTSTGFRFTTSIPGSYSENQSNQQVGNLDFEPLD